MPTKEELEKLILELKTYSKVAKFLKVSHTTVWRWIEKFGIESYKKYYCSCGETNPANFTKGRFTECRKCRSNRQIKLYNKYKQESVNYKGGKCCKCGYNKCLASLDFNHIDPKEKDLNWRKMCHWTFKRKKEELDKCILVCRNCHGEIHYLEE